MKPEDTYVEIEYFQRIKTGEDVCGDDYKNLRLDNENRCISVMSDGLGSGIKANLLANMTTTMALKFISRNMEIISSAEIIMDTLPVCEVRKISYATFSIVDILLAAGKARIVEMDNPPFIHLRQGRDLQYEKQELCSHNWPDRKLRLSELNVIEEDRIILFSDGVTQAGLGHAPHKFGWRREGCLEFIQDMVKHDPHISARNLSRAVVQQACLKNPGGKVIDDVTCGVIYFRRPRRLMLLTGPPFHNEHDKDTAGMLKNYDGHKIVCGGTTANIIARELGLEIETDLKKRNGNLPPVSKMKGIDMVTEGILTLTETAKRLENNDFGGAPPSVRDMIELFHDSDMIDFVVGTRVNEAHQDPSLPVDIEIRRSIVKRIRKCLEKEHLKKVSVKYV